MIRGNMVTTPNSLFRETSSLTNVLMKRLFGVCVLHPPFARRAAEPLRIGGELVPLLEVSRHRPAR